MTALAEIATPMSGAGVARARFAATNEACLAFFSVHADSVSQACHAMAGRFQSGGRLLVYGEGARRSDVSHVVVEFMHPVVVGKRALAALAIQDVSSLEVLGRRGDIMMVLGGGALSESELAILARAESPGMLTLALSGAAAVSPPHTSTRFDFPVPSTDACIVQETHEVLYHVLWELVHVFLDHRVTA